MGAAAILPAMEDERMATAALLVRLKVQALVRMMKKIISNISSKEPMPGDLRAAIALSLLTLAFVLVPELSILPLRLPLALIMLLFLPGYVLMAALFPRKGELGGIEMVALSIGMSIAVVPLIGLELSRTSLGLRLGPVAISLTAFIILVSVIAYLRRSMLASEERFSIGFKKGMSDLKHGLMAEEAGILGKAFIAILVIGIIFSAVALTYMVEAPNQGEEFTEFYILGSDGDAHDYATSIVAGNNSTVLVGIINHEYSKTNYTLSLNLSNSTIMSKRLTLDHNQTWEQPVHYMVRNVGDDQELKFLLYKNQNFTSPYRELHIWINVSANSMQNSAWAEPR